MSKKSRRRRRRPNPSRYENRHHLLFQGRNWARGRARALRIAFARYVPVYAHRELHERLHDVPLPPTELLCKAWDEYKADKEAIDAYDVVRAAAWLYAHIPDVEFRKAMYYQIEYFAEYKRECVN